MSEVVKINAIKKFNDFKLEVNFSVKEKVLIQGLTGLGKPPCFISFTES
ncbi:hypothetical protein [Stygiolobus caldivivus]|nr:hypothetical protein [Stygiolobus caldivivus]